MVKPTPRRKGESHASLLHPLYGHGAQDVRRAVGVSHQARIAKAEELIARMRRNDALHRKGYRGMSLGENGEIVLPGPNGRIDGRSLNDAVWIGADPNGNPHGFALDLDIGELVSQLDLPDPCDCCFTDIKWYILLNPGHPIAWIIDKVNCKVTLSLPCDPCGSGIDVGGA